MDFFGVGPFELLFVLLIAFVLFGPERIIQISKTAGKAMRDLSKSASDLNQKLNQELKLDETSSNDATAKQDVSKGEVKQ